MCEENVVHVYMWRECRCVNMYVCKECKCLREGAVVGRCSCVSVCGEIVGVCMCVENRYAW